MKIKVETTVKERDKQALDFITIDVINIKQKHPLSQDIITLAITPIIYGSFNKHPMPWELVHCHLLQRYDSFMKEMCRHQTLTDVPKHFYNKLKQAPCTLC